MPFISSYITLVGILFLSLFACVDFSTSKRALIEHQPAQSSGLRIKLQRVDSAKNLTKFQRIEHGIKRGKHRLHKLNAAILSRAPDSNYVQAPTHAGNGEFLITLSIGTPPVKYSAIVDTGSDLIWTQCKPCKQCFDQPTPVFDPRKSSSYSKLACVTDLCAALPQSNCNNNYCEYLYTYGDYSSTQGILATETFTFEGKNSVSGVGFGCGDENEGDGFTQGSGLVGLGRGPLSLVSQLKESKFSYCLNSIGDTKSSSTLFLGHFDSNAVNKSSGKDELKTTKLLRNPSQPSFYYLPLQGITVGSTRLEIDDSTFDLKDDGTGGMIIDSGTTITYIEESAFETLKKTFLSQVELPVEDSSSTGLDLCFKLPSDSKKVSVPKLIFNFKDADLELPGENYLVGDSSSGVLCLALGSSSGMSIFGNVQQQNFLVLHDLGKETVSFVPTDCAKM